MEGAVVGRALQQYDRGLRSLAIVVIISAALLAAALAWFATPASPCVTADSMYYFSAANSLAAGQGLTASFPGAVRPITHWPPLYPMILAGLTRTTGADVAWCARELNIVLAMLSAMLVAVVTARLSDSLWPAAAATAVFAVSLPTVRTFATAITEPLFITEMLAVLLLLDAWLRGSRAAGLVLPWLLTATILTRYHGVELLAVVAFVRWRSERAGRWRDLAWVISPAIVLGAGWVWYCVRVGDYPANRVLDFFPLSAWNMRLVRESVDGWFIPGSFCLGAVVGTVVTWIYRAELRKCLRDIVMAQAGAYAATLLAGALFLDPEIHFYHRLMSPLFILAVCMFFGALGKAPRWFGSLMAASFIVSAAMTSAQWIERTRAMEKSGRVPMIRARGERTLTQEEMGIFSDIRVRAVEARQNNRPYEAAQEE